MCLKTAFLGALLYLCWYGNLQRILAELPQFYSWLELVGCTPD